MIENLKNRIKNLEIALEAQAEGVLLKEKEI